MLRPFRKPLVVMTPKSLLRKKEASASIHELASGSFQTVIPELEPLEAKDVKRIIACCGKIYYDLVAKRKELQKTDVAVIRLEQLYPFPHKQFEAEVKRYPGAGEVVWCQEEPQNQGAWYQSGHYLRENMRDEQKLCYAGRPPAASDGVLVKILKNSRDPVTSGDVIAQIDTDAKAAAALSPEKKSLPEKSMTAPPVMPAARKIAAEQGIDTSKIPGTGRDGRVTKGDVLGQAAKAPAARPALQQPPPPVDIEALLSGRPEQRVPMSRLRQRVAERLVQSQHTAAILTTFNEVNMAPVIELRKKFQERFEKIGRAHV